MNEYTKRRESTGTILNFMGTLARRYDSRKMTSLWTVMDGMIERFGICFVADSIESDKSAAELALVRETMPEPVFYEDATTVKETKWQYVEPEYSEGFNLFAFSIPLFGIMALFLMAGTVA